MRTLLCISGYSPMVVPEAFLFQEDKPYERVEVITSEQSPCGVIHEFFRSHPGVQYGVTRVRGFQDLRNSNEQELFEEALYRWYLDKMPTEGLPEVCISGGFKSMSATMQKAAGLFGAEKIFHVLCEIPDLPPSERNPNTLEEMETARKKGGLRFIELGFESGLRFLRTLDRKEFPYSSQPGDIKEEWIQQVNNRDLRNRVAELEGVLRRQLEPTHSREVPPFPSICLWRDSEIKWLEQPLDPTLDEQWVRTLPKIELHCHLGGFATHGELLHKVRAAADGPLPESNEPKLPTGWPLPEKSCGLGEYMDLGNATGSKLLQDPGCLQEHVRLLYQHFQKEQVVYAEVRCSPANYATENRGPLEVLQDIQKVMRECRKSAEAKYEFAPEVNLIVIVTRKKDGDLASITKHLSLAVTAYLHQASKTCRVIGVDLAGYESKETRPMYFQTDFINAHRAGVSVTVHAGENDDAESIWQAVFNLSAQRIGHGLHLRQAPDLLKAVALRRIGIEMCPYANYQIKGFPLDPASDDAEAYPLLEYLKKGVLATVNTDNPGISSASLSDNILLLPRLCPGITRNQILKLQRNAVETAFLDPEGREALLARMDSILATPSN
jgi:adenosine deaminase